MSSVIAKTATARTRLIWRSSTFATVRRSTPFNRLPKREPNPGPLDIRNDGRAFLTMITYSSDSPSGKDTTLYEFDSATGDLVAQTDPVDGEGKPIYDEDGTAQYLASTTSDGVTFTPLAGQPGGPRHSHRPTTSSRLTAIMCGWSSRRPGDLCRLVRPRERSAAQRATLLPSMASQSPAER